MSEKKYPSEKSAFFVAENVREEAGGKVTIIGLYPGGDLRVTPGANPPFGFPLSFYESFVDGVGEFSAGARLISPKNEIMGDFKIGVVKKKLEQVLNLIISFSMIALPSLGKYTVEFYLDDHTYPESFHIKYAEPMA